MLSTHENEYDLEGVIGSDHTPFHLEVVFRSTVLDTREHNINLRAKEEHMLLNFLCNLFSDSLLSTHENAYDLESERGTDANTFPLEFAFLSTVLDTRERI
jgi:hypothetical protein